METTPTSNINISTGIEEVEPDTTVQPATSTTSFKILVVTWLTAIIVGFLTAKGYIVSEQSEMATGLIQFALIGIAGWVSKTFIDGRNKINVVKAQTAGQLKLIRAGARMGVIQGVIPAQ
jgi:hypothetical protein